MTYQPSSPTDSTLSLRLFLPALLVGIATGATAQTPTETSLGQSIASSQPGQAVTLTASVEGIGQTSPQSAPSGQVIFRNDGVEIGRGALEAIGVEVIDVAVGGFHACALAIGGDVHCWGSGEFGQLGNGTTENALVPARVPGLPAVTALAAGAQHSCAIVTSGAVRCWGWGTEGQLGNGATENSSVPVAVTGITSAVAIGSYGLHTCAVLGSGGVMCWGWGTSGQLGNGLRSHQSVPVPVVGLFSAVELALGQQHSCARLMEGALRCWGLGFDGQLGNGELYGDSSVPVSVTGISDAISIASGDNHSCAILAAGSVRCWGVNLEGQLGNRTTGYSASPVDVRDLPSVVSVDAGQDHTCAVLASGAVQCWGAGPLGSLGDGATVRSLVPVAVAGVSSARRVWANTEQSCALMASGQVGCWGAGGPGQLGNGEGQDTFVPVAVVGTGSGARATITTSNLSPGLRRLTAQYPGGAGWSSSTSAVLIHDVARLTEAFVGGGAIFGPTDACEPVLGNTPHPVRVRYTASELSGLPSGVSILWPDGSEHLALWGPMVQSTLFWGGAGRATWSRFTFYPTRPLIRVVSRNVTVPEGGDVVTAQELVLRLRVQNFAATPGCSVTLATTLSRDTLADTDG